MYLIKVIVHPITEMCPLLSCPDSKVSTPQFVINHKLQAFLQNELGKKYTIQYPYTNVTKVEKTNQNAGETCLTFTNVSGVIRMYLMSCEECEE